MDLNLILDSVSDSCVILDRDWIIRYHNDVFGRLPHSNDASSGSDSFEGAVLWDLFPELIGAPIEAELRRAMQTRRAGSAEHTAVFSGTAVGVRFIPCDEGLLVIGTRRLRPQPDRWDDVGDELERYRTFIDHNTEGFWRCDFDEPIDVSLPVEEQVAQFMMRAFVAECNDAMARMHGYASAPELTGVRLAELWSDDPANPAALESFISGDYRSDEQITHERDREGNELFVSNNLIGIVRDGRLVRMWGTRRDVTRQKRAEDALRRSEDRLRIAVEAAHLGPWEFDVRTGAVHWSENLERIHGMEPGSFEGTYEAYRRDIHPDDIDRVLRTIQGTIESGEDHDIEYRIIRPDGEVRWVLGRGQVFRDDTGRASRIAGICMDVTDRKKAEIALRASEERLRLIIESAREYAIFTIDLHGRVTSWNRGAARIFQYDEDEVLGHDCAFVFSDPDEAEHLPALEMARALDHGIATSDGWRRRRDGSKFWASARVMPLRADGGEVHGFLKIVQDQTERMIAETQRNQLLESERAARSEAERANRLKDEFLSIVSHELRTPLNAILGWSQLLLADELDAADRERAIDAIDRNAQAQAKIIEDLLDMSRIISGKIQLEFETVELAPVVEGAVDTLRRSAAEHGVRLVESIDSELPCVHVDQHRLRQVIWNVVSNGIKFTPHDGVVTIAVREREPGQIAIEVTDTGQGIEPEMLPHIFERFRQGDSSTRRRQGGLGLGLAISRSLVESLGGSLTAFSEGPELGSRFIITLPAADQSPHRDDAAPPEHLNYVDARNHRNLLDGVSVLVVDDERDALDLARLVLEQYSATVVTANSVKTALERLKEHRPDVLVSDVGMPDADGYDLIRQVREMAPNAGGRIPAVALTAFARAEDRQRAIRAGYQAHIPKPLDVAALVSAIAALVARDVPPSGSG